MTGNSTFGIAPGLAPPAAHIGGWLWVAYLLPVLIVVGALVKNQLALRKQKPKHPAAAAGTKRRR